MHINREAGGLLDPPESMNRRASHEVPSSSSPADPCPNYLQYDPTLDDQEGEDGRDIPDVANVPLSSSPPDFTSSSPCSDGSVESEDASTSDSSLSDLSSMSPADLSTAEDFGQKLHQLLLVASKERELRDRTDYSFYSDASLSRTPEISDFLSFSEREAQAQHGSDSLESWVTSLSYDDISPINFEDSQALISSQTSISDQRHKRPAEYRIIKRAQSYLSGAIFEQEAEPPCKRQKNGRDASIHAHDRVYARQTASIRRADSLKSADNDYQRTPLSTLSEWVPTAPATPIPSHKGGKSTPESRSIPVPVIAPPVDHVAKLPMSSETFAKLCLMRLLEREADGRQDDGLPSGICARPPACMLPDRRDDFLFDENDEHSVDDDIRFDWEAVMGLGAKRRKTVVAWLLQVLPVRIPRGTVPSVSPSPPSSLLSSGSDTESSPSSDSSYLETGYNLYDQLHNSAETRFHAVWMFLRFFFLTMPPDSQMQFSDEKTGSPKASNSHASKTLEQGLGLISWDMAVACLSLSVKFHRDFLNPLVPVYAQEYLTLAPHCLSHEDLEAAHRDILSSFDYRLGITPQPVMDQLWLALPSLRALLDFEGGWQKTMRSTWSYLYNFLREPDVQRFPVSMLTAVSLMDGILENLVHHHRREALSDDVSSKDGLKNSLNEQSLDIRAAWDDCKDSAKEDAEGVFCDIQALIGVTDVYNSITSPWAVLMPLLSLAVRPNCEIAVSGYLVLIDDTSGCVFMSSSRLV